MNGEIDLVTGSSIQNKFLKSSSCRSSIQNSTLHLKPSEAGLFPSITSRKAEGICADFGSAILTSGENNITCSESLEINRKESDLPKIAISNSSNILQPIGSGQQHSATTTSELNSGLCNPDETNGSHFRSLVTSDHIDIKSMPCNELIDFTKLAAGQVEDQIHFPECDFRNKLTKPHTQNSALDSNMTRNNINSDYMFSRVASDSDNVQKHHSKCDSKSISLMDPENECASEHVGSNNIWNHPNCLGSSVDHNLTFVNDSIQSIISGAVSDDTANMNDAHANGISSLGATASAAKRAITGAHQMSRFSTSNKTAAWTNNSSNGISNSSLGYLVCNAWNANGNNSNVSLKLNAGSRGDSNLVSIANLNNSDSSQLSWSQSTQSQVSRLNSQSLSNMLGNMSYTSSGTTNNYLARNPTCLGNTQLSSSNINVTNSNKALGEAGFTNIYSMFPKRPQHRMMAHWQQQQQHHHPNSQQQTQLGKTFMNPTNSNLQSNGNRINASNVGSNLSNVQSGCGDNTLLNVTGNFNGGCSVLQSITNTVTSSASPLLVGSSGDSFATYGLTGSENSSLDNFKYGMDQQLMEVIKSFEMTSIGCPPTSISACTNTNSISHISGLDDLSCGEIDPQLPALSTVTQLPCSVSNPVCIVSGANSHNSAFSGISVLGSTGMTNPYSVFANVFTREEGYSRKVFVGGLPPDIDEEEITTAFRRFGPLIVDWPHKTESKAYFPPKGYCFLLFQEERSVQSLINACIVDENKYYWCVSSPTMKDKPVQIRPWNLADSDFVMDGSQPLDPRKTIFVGGVPRPLRAIELALIMDRLYGGVCYAGIDTDPELKYPKGAGRVAFSNQQSYIAAISARFVQLQHNEIDKRVEVKPYVLDNQMCDECQGTRCGGKFAPFFCANVTCLQYYCEQCWVQIHSRYGREYHKPLVKEGAERPRPALYRW